jgi:hypothetical protein
VDASISSKYGHWWDWAARTVGAILEKIVELLRRKTRIADNSSHRERIDGIMPWDRYYSGTIAHDDVFALSGNLESGLFEHPDCSQVGDSGYLRHSL